jgi:excisionase family DNA binding protein
MFRMPPMEIIAANDLCRALYDGALDEERLPVNLARYLFLDPHSRGFFLDWDAVADDAVGALRMQAGRNVRDRGLSELIGSCRPEATSSRPGDERTRPASLDAQKARLLIIMVNSATDVIFTPRWYTVAQVAQLLNYGESKVRMLIITGQLRSIKDGRSRRILPEWVDAYVQDRAKATEDPW